MKKSIASIIAFIIWFAVIAQFVLMMQNRVAPVTETITRFFSYFTILTNTMAALFFVGQVFNAAITNKPGNLTAVAVYIFIVCLVYQVLLRQVCNGWLMNCCIRSTRCW